MKVVLIGFGHLGRWHAEKIQQSSHVEFCGIVEKSLDAHNEIKKKFPEVPLYESLEDVKGDFDIGIVVTPTSVHYQVVKELLDKNKHVFCEKPMVSTPEEVEKIALVLKDKDDLKFQVGHSERCHQVWEMVDQFSDFLKPPFSMKINRLAAFKGRATDVDVVQDLMIHDVDIVNMLFKDGAKFSSAIGFKSLTDKWDHCEAQFTFEGNGHIQLISGRNYTHEVRTFECSNRFGTVFIDLFNRKFTKTLKGGEPETIDYEVRDHLLIEHQKFYESIKNNTKTFVDFSDGKDAMEKLFLILNHLDQKGP
jgi:predicted dehydrogenase